MDLLAQIIAIDWLNTSGWFVSVGLVFYILRRFTSNKAPWLTWQQHLTISAGQQLLSDERKTTLITQQELIESQADTIAEQARTLKVVDDFLGKVPVRSDTPRKGD